MKTQLFHLRKNRISVLIIKYLINHRLIVPALLPIMLSILDRLQKNILIYAVLDEITAAEGRQYPINVQHTFTATADRQNGERDTVQFQTTWRTTEHDDVWEY